MTFSWDLRSYSVVLPSWVIEVEYLVSLSKYVKIYSKFEGEYFIEDLNKTFFLRSCNLISQIYKLSNAIILNFLSVLVNFL